MAIEHVIAEAIIGELEGVIEQAVDRIIESRVKNAPLLLNVKEVAQTLSVSPSTVNNLVISGELPRPVYLGGSKRWRYADIEKAVRERTAWEG